MAGYSGPIKSIFIQNRKKRFTHGRMGKRNFTMTEIEDTWNKGEEIAAVSAMYSRIEKADVWVLYGEVSRHWIAAGLVCL